MSSSASAAASPAPFPTKSLDASHHPVAMNSIAAPSIQPAAQQQGANHTSQCAHTRFSSSQAPSASPESVRSGKHKTTILSDPLKALNDTKATFKERRNICLSAMVNGIMLATFGLLVGTLAAAGGTAAIIFGGPPGWIAGSLVVAGGIALGVGMVTYGLKEAILAGIAWKNSSQAAAIFERMDELEDNYGEEFTKFMQKNLPPTEKVDIFSPKEQAKLKYAMNEFEIDQTKKILEPISHKDFSESALDGGELADDVDDDEEMFDQGANAPGYAAKKRVPEHENAYEKIDDLTAQNEALANTIWADYDKINNEYREKLLIEKSLKDKIKLCKKDLQGIGFALEKLNSKIEPAKALSLASLNKVKLLKNSKTSNELINNLNKYKEQLESQKKTCKEKLVAIQQERDALDRERKVEEASLKAFFAKQSESEETQSESQETQNTFETLLDALPESVETAAQKSRVIQLYEQITQGNPLIFEEWLAGNPLQHSVKSPHQLEKMEHVLNQFQIEQLKEQIREHANATAAKEAKIKLVQSELSKYADLKLMHLQGCLISIKQRIKQPPDVKITREIIFNTQKDIASRLGKDSEYLDFFPVFFEDVIKNLPKEFTWQQFETACLELRSILSSIRNQQRELKDEKPKAPNDEITEKISQLRVRNAELEKLFSTNPSA